MKQLIFKLFCLLLGFLFAFFLCEVALRAIPIQGTKILRHKFDPLTGVILYPNSKVVYCDYNRKFICRRVNAQGYIDVAHEKNKFKGDYRIGFFGDSYVEGNVPLEETFFRIIQSKLGNHGIEVFAFGISGFGTLQSYLNSKRWADYYDLDLVVYVFCENDLGDNVREIDKEGEAPYAYIKGDSFGIDNSFQEANRFREDFYYKFFDNIRANSLVISTVTRRLKLLIRNGVQSGNNKENMDMATKSKAGKVPDPSDLPSSWQSFWKEHAKKLGTYIILRWRDDMKIENRDFAVLYIPRNKEMGKEAVFQDSWKQWLENLCIKNNIPFIDPTSDFVKNSVSGNAVFYDHFTRKGHLVFADVFIKWFTKNKTELMKQRNN